VRARQPDAPAVADRRGHRPLSRERLGGGGAAPVLGRAISNLLPRGEGQVARADGLARWGGASASGRPHALSSTRVGVPRDRSRSGRWPRRVPNWRAHPLARTHSRCFREEAALLIVRSSRFVLMSRLQFPSLPEATPRIPKPWNLLRGRQTLHLNLRRSLNAYFGHQCPNEEK